MTDYIKTLLACFPLLSSQRGPFGRAIVSSSSSGELRNMEWSGNQFDKHQNLDTNIAKNSGEKRKKHIYIRINRQVRTSRKVYKERFLWKYWRILGGKIIYK